MKLHISLNIGLGGIYDETTGRRHAVEPPLPNLTSSYAPTPDGFTYAR